MSTDISIDDLFHSTLSNISKEEKSLVISQNYTPIDDSNDKWKIPQKRKHYKKFHKLKYKEGKDVEIVECEKNNRIVCFFCIGAQHGRPVQEIYTLYQMTCNFHITDEKKNRTLFETEVVKNWKNGCDGWGNPPLGCSAKKALK